MLVSDRVTVNSIRSQSMEFPDPQLCHAQKETCCFTSQGSHAGHKAKPVLMISTSQNPGAAVAVAPSRGGASFHGHAFWSFPCLGQPSTCSPWTCHEVQHWAGDLVALKMDAVDGNRGLAFTSEPTKKQQDGFREWRAWDGLFPSHSVNTKATSQRPEPSTFTTFTKGKWSWIQCASLHLPKSAPFSTWYL